MKRVLLVDDEQDARDLLMQYLKDEPDCKVVGQADNGIEAVHKINSLRPDLVFLDIQMPGLNGFEVLKRLHEIPQIIFSTAYDQYAIHAFEVHALDYLLKPYGKKRFDQAMTRLQTQNDGLVPLTEQLLHDKHAYPSRVILYKGKRRLLVDTADILFISAFGDYAKVRLIGDREMLSTSGLSALQEKLHPTDFMRVHRSAVVHLRHAAELAKIGRYHYLVLDDGTQVKISDSYLPAVKRFIL